VVTFCGTKIGYFLDELCDLSGNHHNLKLFLSLTPKTFQAGPKNEPLFFTSYTATKNTVDVPKICTKACYTPAQVSKPFS